MISSFNKYAVEEILKELEVLASTYFSIKSFNYNTLYDLKSTRILGMFVRSKNKLTLRFHPGVIAIFGIEKYRSVIVHEFAHMLVHMVYGYTLQSHGKEWRKIMKLLGDPKPRATTKDFPFNPHLNKMRVSCTCGSIKVSVNNFFIVHSSVVKCRKCNSIYI